MINPASFSLLAQALGWSVLHSIWQISLIWAIYKALSALLRGRNQVIYLASLLAMCAAVLSFFGTFIWEINQLLQLAEITRITAPLHEAAIRPAITIGVETGATVAPSLFQSALMWLESHVFQIGWAWAIGVLFLWIRLLGGWWMVQRLRVRDIVKPSAALQQQCQNLAQKLGINTMVRLLESPHVQEPLTLGFWKPLILFPSGMLLQLAP